jgi:hypothetical protein
MASGHVTALTGRTHGRTDQFCVREESPCQLGAVRLPNNRDLCKFWRCVQFGELPHLINAEPPRPRIEAIRIVDMSSSNSWAEFAALFRSALSRPRARQG